MESSLISLPTELLLHILSFLPVRSLLSFSLTCRTSHSLAASSLHTLSLGIYPSRMASIISRLTATPPSTAPSSSVRSWFPHSKADLSDSLVDSDDGLSASFLCDPHTVSVIIPEAYKFDYATLLKFQGALASSIFVRYRNSLRHLDICLWALNSSIAKSLTSIKQLHTLSIHIENPMVRQMDRDAAVSKLCDESLAWEMMAGAWTRLRAIHLEGADISASQLCAVLQRNTSLRELWLRRCCKLGKSLWRLLGDEWQGRDQLEILGISNVRVTIDDDDLEWIGGLTGLKYFSLSGCRGLDLDALEEANDSLWHVPELVLPRPFYSDLADVIEVDPAYLDSSD